MMRFFAYTKKFSRLVVKYTFIDNDYNEYILYIYYLFMPFYACEHYYYTLFIAHFQPDKLLLFS